MAQTGQSRFPIHVGGDWTFGDGGGYLTSIDLGITSGITGDARGKLGKAFLLRSQVLETFG